MFSSDFLNRYTNHYRVITIIISIVIKTRKKNIFMRHSTQKFTRVPSIDITKLLKSPKKMAQNHFFQCLRIK